MRHALIDSALVQRKLVFSGSPQTHSPIKLLLADDSKIIRRGICQLLANDAAIQVVGEAASFGQTIQMAQELNPRVVLMDLHMPDEREFTPQQVRTNLNRESRVLAMSLRNDQAAQYLADSFGAAILLDKAELAKVLIPSIVRLAP
jgi:DNA-binding NarL/FixJ family response regulator